MDINSTHIRRSMLKVYNMLVVVAEGVLVGAMGVFEGKFGDSHSFALPD